ncbi:MAG TPA: Fe-S-containing hydro-lyase [Dehalococcoidia bacterium]|nr:Fe-S-containing hydro-lyase [Dehalococcoidia bacterium]
MERITSPISTDIIEKLRAGDQVLISGVIYVGRDAAHKRLIETLDKGEQLPFDIQGQTIYYMGPSPTKPGHVIGSAGPTTSGRMDAYTPRLLSVGLRAMIGKGLRSEAVKEALKKHRGVYLAAVGGAAALIAKSITKAQTIAYEDLGPEAILRLEVKDFPAVVINDMYGGDLYQEGKAQYQIRA